MALSKEKDEEMNAFADAIARGVARAIASPAAADPVAAKRRAEYDEKRSDIYEATHKGKTSARYRVTVPSYVKGQGLISNQVITVSLDHEPSHSWLPVDKSGNSLVKNAKGAWVAAKSDEVDLDADPSGGEAATPEDLADADAKAKAKGKRASDQDVA